MIKFGYDAVTLLGVVVGCAAGVHTLRSGMRDGALPIEQQIILDLVGPPIITAFWLLFSRGWVGLLGTSGGTTVRGWIKSGTWILLIVLYIVAFSITAYGYFTP